MRVNPIFTWIYQKVAYIVHTRILDKDDRYIVRFRNHMSKEDMKRIATAYRLAFKAHYGQYRGDGVTFYFDHCLDLGNFISVELGMKDDWKINVAALLHDTPEDSDITLEYLKNIFNEIVAHWIGLMTKGPMYKKDKSSYITNLHEAKIIQVLILKLGDRIVNLRTLGMKDDTEFQIKQINETIRDYLPLANLLVGLILKSKDKIWENRSYIGEQIRDELLIQIKSFANEYGDKIDTIPDQTKNTL